MAEVRVVRWDLLCFWIVVVAGIYCSSFACRPDEVVERMRRARKLRRVEEMVWKMVLVVVGVDSELFGATG